MQKKIKSMNLNVKKNAHPPNDLFPWSFITSPTFAHLHKFAEMYYVFSNFLKQILIFFWNWNFQQKKKDFNSQSQYLTYFPIFLTQYLIYRFWDNNFFCQFCQMFAPIRFCPTFLNSYVSPKVVLVCTISFPSVDLVQKFCVFPRLSP